jgi:hypothetical protein
MIIKDILLKLGMMAHTCNLSAQEAKTGGSQLEVRPCVKTKHTKKNIPF